MLEAAKKGIIRGAAPNFKAPQRAEPHSSLQPRSPKGREARWSRMHRRLALLSQFAGKEGEESMPCFQLFPSPQSGRAAVQKKDGRLVLL